MKTLQNILLVVVGVTLIGFTVWSAAVKTEAQMLGAQPALTTFQGGTGTSSPSGILYGDSTIRLKTVVIGTGLGFSGGTLSVTGSYLSSYDAWTHPSAGISATTSQVTVAGLLSTASSTFSSALRLPSLSQGILYTGSTGLVGTAATSSFSLSGFTNDLAALTAGNSSLTFSGSYNGATARTVSLNVGNTNTWTVLQNFNYSSSTIYSSFLTASSTTGYFGTLHIPALGTAAGTFLAVDANGKVIATSTPSGSATPGGADTQIQFNDGGSFGGDADFVWNKISNTASTTNLSLPTTTSATVGVIYKGGLPFIHAFRPIGWPNDFDTDNLFIGRDAGNFTMTYGSAIDGSNNTGVGAYALHSLTTGYQNTGIGLDALYSNTTGYYNTALGQDALVTNTVGHDNSAFGVDALYYNTEGNYNIAMGRQALFHNTTGAGNVAIGWNTAKDPLNLTNGTFIGLEATGADDTDNATAIGNGATATISNQVVIGNSAVTETRLRGDIKILDTSATVAAILDPSSIASTDKTFTFPNQTGTLCLTATCLTSYDAWTHPSAGVSATSSEMRLASTTSYGQFLTRNIIATSTIGIATSTFSGAVHIGSTTPMSVGEGQLFIVGTTTKTYFHVGTNGKMGIFGINNNSSRLSIGDGSNADVHPNVLMLIQDPTDARFGASVNSSGIFMKNDGGIYAYNYTSAAPKNINFQEFAGAASTVGISTSTPWAKFAINPRTGEGANAFVVGSSTATHLIVTNDGRLGVGTTTPGATFAVTGTGLISSDLTVSGTLKTALYKSFAYSTSTAWTGTTTIPLGPAYLAETWNGVKCFTDTGTVNVSFYDGTNRMNLFNASTTVGTVSLTTNNTFTASEKRYVDIGTPASSPTKISCTVNLTN